MSQLVERKGFKIESVATKKKKNKEKKSKSNVVQHVHIIDDDAPIPWNDTTTTATTKTKKSSNLLAERLTEQIDNDELISAEDAPVIVGIIDERPADVRERERLRNAKKWRAAAFEEVPEPGSIGPQPKPSKSSNRKQTASDDSDPDIDRRQTSKTDDQDLSPPRRKTQPVDDDPSPPRRRRQPSDDDPSPPRRNKKDDPSPPRRKREDRSPPRRKRESDDYQSPPRRRKNDDASPPRRRKDDDSSPARRKKNDDASPPRRKHEHRSSHHEKHKHKDVASSSRHRDKYSPSSSSSRRHDKKHNRKRSSSSSSSSSPSSRVRQVKKESSSPSSVHRRPKEESPPPLPTEPAKSERRRLAEQKEKVAERYAQWGRGLAQVRQQNEAVQDYIEQAAKPLARYRNDQDLDTMLKQQEREDDPMLKYLTKKPSDAGDRSTSTTSSAPVKPRYKGPEPQRNRFGIWPGYRWDGVDRSNGYEKKLFESIASRHAKAQEAYLWSVEDM